MHYLSKRKCSRVFVVYLLARSRLWGWNTNPQKNVSDLIKMQTRNTQQRFQERAQSVILQFAEQNFNASFFYENENGGVFLNNSFSYLTMVPTSAATGDGMGNLIALIAKLTRLWPEAFRNRIPRDRYGVGPKEDELHAIVLEVQVTPGYGTTIDVILVNGALREGDRIVLAGLGNYPIVTQIRSLLLPQAMEAAAHPENQIVRGPRGNEPCLFAFWDRKNNRYPTVSGVKIAADNLENTCRGSSVLVFRHQEELDRCERDCKEEWSANLKKTSQVGRLVPAKPTAEYQKWIDSV